MTWSWSVVSPSEDGNWTDPAGNLHAIGSGKVSHIWALRTGGRRLSFWDPWLPLRLHFDASLSGSLPRWAVAQALDDQDGALGEVNHPARYASEDEAGQLGTTGASDDDKVRSLLGGHLRDGLANVTVRSVADEKMSFKPCGLHPVHDLVEHPQAHQLRHARRVGQRGGG